MDAARLTMPTPSLSRPPLLLILALWQTTPTGGAIAKLVPPMPTPASFISDQRSVLNDAQHRALDARITAFQHAGLGDIAVAILPSIGDYAPQQVAVEIYRTWKVGSVAPIGNAHRNVGALLLIVPKELAPDRKGQCFILTGTGTEGIITDAQAGAMCRDSIIPHLREKDYGGAIGAGIGAIEARMRTESELLSTPVPANGGRGSSKAPVLFGIFGGIGALLLAIAGGTRYSRYRQRTCPRCGRRMRRLDEQSDDAKLDPGQRMEERLESVDYDVWVCECGESKTIPYRKWFSKYSECRECHRRTASSSYIVLIPATTVSSGAAEKRFACQNCGAHWIDHIILPRIVQSSSSSSSSGGGGGGGSFGGSGSTSGGGGGSSY
jgi:uncharacterized protein